MKNRLFWAALVAFLLVATTAWSYKGKIMDSNKKEHNLVTELRSLSRLYSNFDRDITEYDHSNDTGADTLLWSRDKTIEESRKLLTTLLAERESLRGQKDEALARQSLVERWRLNLNPKLNLYQNILEVTYQFSRAAEEFKPLLEEELNYTLSHQYYPEALQIVRWTGDDVERLTELRSKFSTSPEGALIDMWLLRERVQRELMPVENKLFQEGGEQFDAEWSRLATPLIKEGRAILTRLEGTPYESEAKGIYNANFGDKRLSLTATVTDVSTGKVEIKISGIFTKLSQLVRGEQVIGEIPNGIVRTTLTDYLPKAGNYVYTTTGRNLYAYLTYEQIKTYRHTLKEHHTQIEVLSRITGDPVAGVHIDLLDEDRNILSTTATDAEGRALFKSQKHTYWVRVTDPRLAEGVEYIVPQLPSTATYNYETKQLSFYTDRPLYRRGQKVHAGLVLSENKNDKKQVLPHQTIEVKLQADRGFEEVTIETQQVETNQNGVAEVTFTLPEDQELSDFRLATDLDDHFIQVQDYKRSYLTIEIDSIPTGYVKGQAMTIFGRTTDLNRLPTSATVQLTYGADQRIEVISGSDGQFVINTPKIDRKGEGCRLELAASDALGNTAKELRQLPTSDTDMPLEANRLLGHSIDKVDKEHFTLTTATQPYNSRLLGDLSDRHLFGHLISAKDTIALGELPIQGEQTFELPNIPSGRYRLQLTTIDGYGKEVTDTSARAYYFYSPRDTRLYGEETLWAERLKSGELLFGSGDDATIMLLLQQEGVVVYKEYIKAQAGQLYRHTLPQIEAGEIVLYGLNGMSEPSLSIRIDQAEVQEGSTHFEGLSFDKPLRPGEELQKQIIVRSKSGKPLAGVPVIATVYDKAVHDAAEALGFGFWSFYPDYPLWRGDFAYQELALGAAPLRTASVEAAPMMKNQVAMDTAVATQDVVVDESLLRSNFAETAYFSALLVTDEAGAIGLQFKLPDSQTKYITKLYAFTPDFEEEVMDDATFEVYSPLSIELSTPRFLTWGDRLEGEAQIRNAEKVAHTVHYQICEGDKALAEGEVLVPAEGVTVVKFATIAPEGRELLLQASVTGDGLQDAIERVVPLESNLSTYIVAKPISLYKESQVTLELPKLESASSDLTLELYLDPIQLLLSKMAISYRESQKAPLELFATLHYYHVFSRLHDYLQLHPQWAQQLAADAVELRKIESKPALWGDRIADPQTLAAFYRFITDEERLTARLSEMERKIQSHAVVGGGFRYSRQQLDASPWLTHYILDALAGLKVTNAELQKSLQTSLPYLVSQLKDPKFYYEDYVGFALIAHEYHYELPDLGNGLQRQVELLRQNYQRSSNSTMLRFARYSRAYDVPATFAEVRQFIQDRSEYTFNDDEKLALMLFLNADEEGVREEVVKFALQTKQNTIWYDRAIVEVAEVILDKLQPTTIAPQATLSINGENYKLSPEEQITGAVAIRYPAKDRQLALTWSGVESNYIFGGLSYTVTQPSAEVTPTGEKLKVEKQIYVRQVDVKGRQTFALAKEVKKGDRLIVRYLIETAQDLSLVTILDARPATSEFGYDFEGYRFADRLWFDYSRRDTHDRLYIDYLPRGRHQIELEATATQSGHFVYGPAQIKSYYAPEYAGNSAGGTIIVSPPTQSPPTP